MLQWVLHSLKASSLVIFPFKICVSLFLKIDFLQQKNQDLQTQLDKSLSKARSAIDLDARNYELTKELQDVDVMAAQLQREKDKIMHAADLEINQAKVKHDNYLTYFWIQFELFMRFIINLLIYYSLFLMVIPALHFQGNM